VTELEEKEMELAVGILTRLRSMSHHESIGYPEVMIYASMSGAKEKEALEVAKKAAEEIRMFLMEKVDKTIPVWAYMYAMIDTVLVLYATNIAAATRGEGKEILNIIDSHIAEMKEEAAGKKKDGDEQVAYR